MQHYEAGWQTFRYQWLQRIDFRQLGRIMQDGKLVQPPRPGPMRPS
jgi:hypothetical protein